MCCEVVEIIVLYRYCFNGERKLQVKCVGRSPKAKAVGWLVGWLVGGWRVHDLLSAIVATTTMDGLCSHVCQQQRPPRQPTNQSTTTCNQSAMVRGTAFSLNGMISLSPSVGEERDSVGISVLYFLPVSVTARSSPDMSNQPTNRKKRIATFWQLCS